MSQAQYGFRESRCTENAVVRLRERIEHAKKQGDKHIAAVLFDIVGAFNNVWWDLILHKIKKIGCSSNLYRVMQSYFDKRQMRFQWAQEEEEVKEASRGCFQGSVLGPLCWNIQFEGLLTLLEQVLGDDLAAYADDLLVILWAASRLALQNQGQTIVDIVLKWAKFARLQVSQPKTVAVYISKPRAPWAL